MKGRANFACRQKIYDADFVPLLSHKEDVGLFREIQEWEQKTTIGDRAELHRLPEYSTLWNAIDARGDLCAGQKCKQFERCFITAMHQRAVESNLIIVNHSLFFADLAVRDEAYGGILPDYGAVVFDEAHEIEDVAGQYFGMTVSNLQVQELIRDTGAIARRKLFTSATLDRALVYLHERSEQFFALFPHEGRRGFRDQDQFLELHSDIYSELLLAFNLLVTQLELVQGGIEEVIPLVRRAKLIQAALKFWLESNDRKFVYWTDRRGRGTYLQATPIDVSQHLTEKLADRIDTVVLTSATLTVSGSFEYATTRLGMRNARTLHVDGHFDYATQALLYVPQHMPDPRQANFALEATEEIVRILESSRGRAFVLFTSYVQMRQIFELMQARTSFPTFLQGSAPKTALIDLFRSTPNAVLFATSSFWQGVDVQGEQLSCVIIDRIPFAVPSDPVVAARVEAIRENGGDAFYEYQVPEAALTLKQGFGRLIRSQTDRGVLVLLDNRIMRSRYGKVFFESLPPYRLTTKLEDVQSFFNV